MHAFLSNDCGIPVWFYLEKKWWYGLESTGKVPVCHTVPLPADHVTSVMWRDKHN